MSEEIVREFLAVMKERALKEMKAPASGEWKESSREEEAQASQRERKQQEETEAAGGASEQKSMGAQKKGDTAKASEASQGRKRGRKAEHADTGGRGEKAGGRTASEEWQRADEAVACQSGQAMRMAAGEAEPAKGTARAAGNGKGAQRTPPAAAEGTGHDAEQEGLRAATVNVNITIDGMTVREETDIERIAGQLASRIEQAACLF